MLSADMKDDLDIMRKCRQLYAQGNALARRFHMCSDYVKVTIFRSYCSSLYSSQLWWKYKVNSIRKLYVAYNNAFRMLLLMIFCSKQRILKSTEIPNVIINHMPIERVTGFNFLGVIIDSNLTWSHHINHI